MHIYVFIHILTSQCQFKNQHYSTKRVEWLMGNQHLNVGIKVWTLLS
jgi:hypothetical protein